MKKEQKKLMKIGVVTALIGVVGSTSGYIATPIVAKAQVETQKSKEINMMSADYNLQPLYGLIDTGVFEEFIFNEDGTLGLKISLEEAIVKYELTFSQGNFVSTILDQGANLNAEQGLNINSRLHIEGLTIYFDHNDVIMYLSSVAMVGPAAVVAAIVAATSLIGTPVAGAIAGIIGGLSAAAIYATVMDAIWAGKGFYIGFSGWGTW